MQTTLPTPVAPVSPRRVSLAWVGMLPFLLFAFAFLVWPATNIMASSFRSKEGLFTLANIAALSQPLIIESYRVSIQLSVITALLGAALGALLAWAISIGGLPRSVRAMVITFCSVAANFGGIPLAFAFITLLGRTGALTKFLRDGLGWDIYANGFSIYRITGLVLAYLYFQFPLMVLIMVPAFDGLKREWREAAANLGGNVWHYWRHIGVPILLPSLLGSTVLLFGNAFGAYATAEALTGSKVDIITRVISRQIRGDVFYNPGLSYVLALGMIWLILIFCAVYLIVPLLTQFDYSLRMRRDALSMDAYTSLLSTTTKDGSLPRFYSSLLFSSLMALLTIAVSTLILVPTA